MLGVGGINTFKNEGGCNRKPFKVAHSIKRWHGDNWTMRGCQRSPTLRRINICNINWAAGLTAGLPVNLGKTFIESLESKWTQPSRCGSLWSGKELYLQVYCSDSASHICDAWCSASYVGSNNTIKLVTVANRSLPLKKQILHA